MPILHWWTSKTAVENQIGHGCSIPIKKKRVRILQIKNFVTNRTSDVCLLKQTAFVSAVHINDGWLIAAESPYRTLQVKTGSFGSYLWSTGVLFKGLDRCELQKTNPMAYRIKKVYLWCDNLEQLYAFSRDQERRLNIKFKDTNCNSLCLSTFIKWHQVKLKAFTYWNVLLGYLQQLRFQVY